MVKRRLAVFADHIGARSETFIRRHMQALLPDETVVFARTARQPDYGHWDVSVPKLVLEDLPDPSRLARWLLASPDRPGLPRRAVAHCLRRLGRPPSPAAVRAVRDFLGAAGVEAVLGEWLHTSLPWFLALRDTGVRFYAHAHGLDVSKAKLEEVLTTGEYSPYADASGVITMNRPSAGRLAEIGIPTGLIHVVHYGVCVPTVPPERETRDVVTCLAVGRMVAKKAPIYVLDAFRRAADHNPSLRLVYIGDGPLFPSAQQFVAALRLDRRVELVGSQDHSGVLERLRSADVFLQHSVVDPITGDEEGLPLSILEAMAQALPVVSTYHSGIPEAVIDKGTGYLVAEGDTVGMAERILELASSPNLRRLYGSAGWERARAEFSWERERTELLRIMGLGTPELGS